MSNNLLKLPTTHYPLPTHPMYQSVSPADVKKRRQQLRRQRRIKFLQALWRFIWMVGIIAGVTWLLLQPSWKISTPAQVEIVGNRYLSDDTIRSLLPIRYPQWLIQLEPEKIRQELLQQGGITAVDVDRALVPPRLTIRIDDRPPVAMVISAAEPDMPQGFLDPSGKFTPIARYRNIARPTPKLKVILPSSNRCSHWEQIYPAINTSPVAIGVLDCRNSSNLMLQTEIGKVKLGSYVNDRHLAEQIDQLDRLRNWQTSADPHQVDYLDLENPAFPKLQRPQAGTAIIQNSAP